MIGEFVPKELIQRETNQSLCESFRKASTLDILRPEKNPSFWFWCYHPLFFEREIPEHLH